MYTYMDLNQKPVISLIGPLICSSKLTDLWLKRTSTSIQYSGKRFDETLRCMQKDHSCGKNRISKFLLQQFLIHVAGFKQAC